MENLAKCGYNAYAVGGCIRDLIMEKPPKDWDICSNAMPYKKLLMKAQEIINESYF